MGAIINNADIVGGQKEKDVYSEQETLTNKIWMGKPVYRKCHIVDNPELSESKNAGIISGIVMLLVKM